MTRSLSALVVLIFFASSAIADERAAPTKEQLDFFETKIRPVLVEQCYKCHAAEAKIIKGGLRLDSRDGLLKGGDTGPSVVPGQADKSLLLKALKYDEIEMPPKGKLPESVVKDFETWINMGLPDPRKLNDSPKSRTIDIQAGRKFWAFQPVSDPTPPKVKDTAWPFDPIDRFVLAKLEDKGLKPVADADRYTWLRRVTFDLTGLPPTTNEIGDFIRDQSAQAREKVVDRLLASRAYGERWARHWLDLTGYSDMMGTSNNVYAEHAWRYRDYLVDAFNIDKPFDRFIREQIAGDLIKADTIPERAKNITATGFLMVGDVEIVEPDKAKLEADHIDTQMTKIGTAFLGMTLGCVRCHDHKFDPIGVADYYGIAGMLRSSPSTHKIPYGVWSLLNSTELPETLEEREARLKLEADHQKKLVTMKAEQTKLTEEKKSVEADLAKLMKDDEKKTHFTKRRDELAGQLTKLSTAIQHAEFFRSKAPRAFALHDSGTPADMPIYIRGNPYALGAVVPRGVMSVASWEKSPEIPKGQSGRLQLADWLADKRNPLTARVTVNRIWQKLFGEGIVRSVDYFGSRGETPSHPELLDHLATRFVNNGWSQKRLLRAVVLSRVYGLSGINDESALKLDPENRLLWRMNRQRLEAEAIRDSLLAVSGELQPSEGGPGLVLEEPENCGSLVLKGVNPPNYTHRKPRAVQEFQRTIYLPVMRTNTTETDRIRNFFDFVNPAQIAGQRSQTVVPTQSLFLMNNGLFRKRAKVLADGLIAQHSKPDERLKQLWLTVYNRPITSDELDSAKKFLAELSPLVQAKESLLWQELCHSLLASNEFVFRI
jgi:cytochrome c553